MDDSTVAHLIERAISWEISAHNLYVALSKAFPSYPIVTSIWKQMAVDESTHAAILRKTRDALPESNLAKRLETEQIALIESVESELACARLAKLHTLDDAYELAHGLESSEVNTVFQLLVSLQSKDASTNALLNAQLEEHLGRLTYLASQFDRAARRSILIQT